MHAIRIDYSSVKLSKFQKNIYLISILLVNITKLCHSVSVKLSHLNIMDESFATTVYWETLYFPEAFAFLELKINNS